MTSKKPTKKNLVEKKAPNYEPDIERLHNLVRIELAVIKAEEEKKNKNGDIKRINGVNFIRHYNNRYPFELMEYIRKVEKEKKYKTQQAEDEKNWKKQKEQYDNHVNPVKKQYKKYIIRSIILSLGLGATIMFLILNNM